MGGSDFTLQPLNDDEKKLIAAALAIGFKAPNGDIAKPEDRLECSAGQLCMLIGMAARSAYEQAKRERN